MKIQGKIESQKSNWQFDREVVKIFDDHVRKSVPLYNEIHELVVDIAGWFLEDHTNVYDIGTSTGECVCNLSNSYPYRQVQFIGVDISSDMVTKAKERFISKNNVTIVNGDITDSDFYVTNASFITAILTLQFIPQRKRQNLLNKIYSGLNKGSGFIMVEKIIGNNARFDEMWIDLYHDLKVRNGLTENEVFAKSRTIRGIMKPNTVEENIHMLSDAGFQDVDMFFKWNNFAGFLAIK